jgi:cobalt/nickel transport system ATP-binding protein
MVVRLIIATTTAYLEPIQTRNLLLELDSIAKLGTTLLIATHDLDFVYQWADWVLVMEAGQLIAEGETTAVFDQLQSMPNFQLGMPTLWQLWSQIADRIPTVAAPRSIAEFNTYLVKYITSKSGIIDRSS